MNFLTVHSCVWSSALTHWALTFWRILHLNVDGAGCCRVNPNVEGENTMHLTQLALNWTSKEKEKNYGLMCDIISFFIFYFLCVHSCTSTNIPISLLLFFVGKTIKCLHFVFLSFSVPILLQLLVAQTFTFCLFGMFTFSAHRCVGVFVCEWVCTSWGWSFLFIALDKVNGKRRTKITFAIGSFASVCMYVCVYADYSKKAKEFLFYFFNSIATSWKMHIFPSAGYSFSICLSPMLKETNRFSDNRYGTGDHFVLVRFTEESHLVKDNVVHNAARALLLCGTLSL